jgi:hypothetical protein
MDFMGITSVVSITVICYLAAMAIKLTPLDNKWLPVVCGVLGGILGILSLYFMTGFPADDAITSVAVGIVSGLAATGANQVFKQLSPTGIKSDEGKGAVKRRRQ